MRELAEAPLAALDSLVDTLGRLTAVADGGSRRILGELAAGRLTADDAIKALRGGAPNS